MSKLTKRQLLALAAAAAASPAAAQTSGQTSGQSSGQTAAPAQPQTAPAPAADPAAGQAPAQATPAAPAPTAEAAKPAENLGKTVKVRLSTPLGPIVLALFVERAPITTANFLRYVDSKRFDGSSFYRRSIPKGSTGFDYGVVQGGLRNAPDKLYPPIKHESPAKTGIKHTDGTVSMGRHAPGTATADFFICVGDQAYLDGGKNDPGFAAFARVIEGMDVVKKILARKVDPNAGVGVMKGEYLATPVPITTARRVS